MVVTGAEFVRRSLGASAILAGAALIWLASAGLQTWVNVTWADTPWDMAGGGVVHLGLLNVVLPGLMGVCLVIAGALGLSRGRSKA